MKSAKSPTTLEHAILGLLAGHAQSGYDLLNVFENTAMGNYSSSPGAIYPALRRLEKRGLVQGEVDDTHTLRPKKVFEPTAEGHRQLRAWLTAEIGTDDVRRRLDDLLLRFAFHFLLDSEATRTFLRRFAAEVSAYVTQLEGERTLLPKESPPHGRMAFELGIDQYRAYARWARRTLRHFEEESS